MSYDPQLPPNYRDVAESTKATAFMRTGMVLRSAQYYTVKHLTTMGVKTVVDVRRGTPSAADNAPSVRHAMINFVPTGSTGWRLVFLLPFCGTHSLTRIVFWPFDAKKVIVQGLMTDNERMCNFYWLVLSYSTVEIAEAIRVFADPKSYPVLIHCIHGKDRTGILVALVSMLCGAAASDVCDDYCASDANLQAAFRAGAIPPHESWLFAPADDEALRCTRTPRVVMERTLKRVEAEFGGVEGYLKSIGLTQSELDAVRANLAPVGAAGAGTGGGGGDVAGGAATKVDAPTLPSPAATC